MIGFICIAITVVIGLRLGDVFRFSDFPKMARRLGRQKRDNAETPETDPRHALTEWQREFDAAHPAPRAEPVHVPSLIRCIGCDALTLKPYYCPTCLRAIDNAGPQADLANTTRSVSDWQDALRYGMSAAADRQAEAWETSSLERIFRQRGGKPS